MSFASTKYSLFAVLAISQGCGDTAEPLNTEHCGDTPQEVSLQLAVAELPGAVDAVAVDLGKGCREIALARGYTTGWQGEGVPSFSEVEELFELADFVDHPPVSNLVQSNCEQNAAAYDSCLLTCEASGDCAVSCGLLEEIRAECTLGQVEVGNDAPPAPELEEAFRKALPLLLRSRERCDRLTPAVLQALGEEASYPGCGRACDELTVSFSRLEEYCSLGRVEALLDTSPESAGIPLRQGRAAAARRASAQTIR